MMIYPIDLSDLNRKYVVIMKPDSSVDYILESFIKKAKVDPNKYAGQMLKGIISNFFVECEDMQYIFEKYYSKEYDKFEDYLYKKILIDKDEIDFLMSKSSDKERLYYVDLRNAVSNNDEHLFSYEKEDLLEKINYILEDIS
jgi:hypothetical protein